VETTEASPSTGTYRVDDGSEVSLADAQLAWTAAAREVLIETAGRYQDYVTYGQLAELVQERSGIRTRSQMRTWINGILALVAAESIARNEPPLRALCVRQDESVGASYGDVALFPDGNVPADLEAHAASARLDCYRYFGAAVPPGGGHPELTRKVAASRKRAAKQREVPPVLCPTCFTQLPSSGQCDNCAM
jgi:hypothetical protein